MENDKKKSMTLLLVVVVPVIIFIAILLVSGKEEKSVQQKKNIEADVPIPEAQKEEVSSKMQQYIKEREENERREREKESQRNIKKEISDVFTGDDMEGDSKAQTKDVKEESNVARNIEKTRKKEETRVVKKQEQKEEVVKAEEENKYYSSMGIVNSGTSSRKETEKNETVKENKTTDDFIPVVLDETTVIKTGTMVVFVNKQDFEYNGKVIERNSYIYCKARLTDVCELEAVRAKKTNGEIVQLQKFKIYDERFSYGLPLDDKINESAKEAAGDVAQEENPGLYTGNLMIDASANLLKKATNKAINKRERNVILEQGYKVYLKYTVE